MAKRRLAGKDRTLLEHSRLGRLRADYEKLTIGERIEQGAQLSWIGTELARRVAGER